MELLYTSKTPLIEFYFRWRKSPDSWKRGKTTDFFSHEVLSGPLFQKEIERIEPLELKAFFQTMLVNGRKPGTVKNYKIILNQIFESAVFEGIIGQNPINMSGKLPVTDSYRRMFSDAEMKSIEGCLQLKPIGALYMFVRYTGLYPGEAESIAWSDVDLKNRRIFVKKQDLEELEEEYLETGLVKARVGAMRTVPLCQGALTVLTREQKLQRERFSCTGKETLLEDEDCLVFTDNFGDAYCMNDISGMNAFVQKKTGIHDFNLAKLRVHFCLELLKSGVNTKTMAGIAGLQGRRGTANYQKEYEKMRREMKEGRIELCVNR